MEVRGSALVVFRPFITERFGEVGYHDWLAALPPASQDILRRDIDINSWYPIREAFINANQALCDQFYGGDAQGAWEVGHFSAQYAFNWFYKSLIRLTTARMFILRAATALPQYYRPSALAVPEIGEGRALICVTRFPLPNLLADQRIAGWTAGAMEAHGQREVAAAVTKSLARGDPYTEILLTWK